MERGRDERSHHVGPAYGVVRAPDGESHVALRVDEHVVDLADAGVGDDLPLRAPTLNPLLELGHDAWEELRRRASALIDEPPRGALRRLSDVEVLMPVAVADYVDFYSSRDHAENVARIFRPDGPLLPPGWLHMPLGYHGRAATVVGSGTPVRRPRGLRPGDPPAFGPEGRLDVELELGVVCGPGPADGAPIPVDRAEDHIFGVVLLADWSAREIQFFESQPLGPFLGKAFATSISRWVVPLPALRRAGGPPHEPAAPPHLRAEEPRGLDLEVELALRPAGATEATVVTRGNARTLYWSFAQQLAHLSSCGATVRAGDLLGSGTISGAERGSEGCFLELSRNGSEPLSVGGVERTFLQDGDEVILRAPPLAPLSGTVLPPYP